VEHLIFLVWIVMDQLNVARLSAIKNAVPTEQKNGSDMLKDFLRDFLYSRRTITGKLYRGKEIKCDFVSEDDNISGATIQVEQTDLDKDEVSVTVYMGNDAIAALYLSPEMAKELALVLYEPLKG
jgi:hypothetical protein